MQMSILTKLDLNLRSNFVRIDICIYWQVECLKLSHKNHLDLNLNYLGLTTKLRERCAKKIVFHKKAIRSKIYLHWNAFKHQRNLVSNLIKEAHNRYINDVNGNSLSENPKKFWSYVRNGKSDNLGIPPIKEQRFTIKCFGQG